MLDADLCALVGDNVFCQELPPAMASAEPLNAIVIQDTTGSQNFGGYSNLREPSYNVFCMGETPELAKAIYLRVYEILRQVRRQVVNECLIHWYDQTSSPRAMHDVQTKWPYILSVWKSLSATHQAK